MIGYLDNPQVPKMLHYTCILRMSRNCCCHSSPKVDHTHIVVCCFGHNGDLVTVMRAMYTIDLRVGFDVK